MHRRIEKRDVLERLDEGCKWGDANTGADTHSDRVVIHVLAAKGEGTGATAVEASGHENEHTDTDTDAQTDAQSSAPGCAKWSVDGNGRQLRCPLGVVVVEATSFRKRRCCVCVCVCVWL